MEFLFPSFTPPLGGARASSHNWSSSAETRNDENTLVIHHKIVTDQYFQAFAYLYNFAGGVLNASDFAISNYEILLYPNPTDGIAFFKTNSLMNNAYGNYIIYNAIGSKMMEKQFRNLGNTQIDLTAYPKGLYFINLTVAGKVYQAKIIKK